MTKYIGFQYSDLFGGFFTFQQDLNAPTRATGRVRPCSKLVSCESPDFIAIAPALRALGSQQSWPEPGRLPDLGEALQPDAWRWPAEVTPDRRVGTFPTGVHWWSDQAVASTSSRLHSNTRRTLIF